MKNLFGKEKRKLWLVFILAVIVAVAAVFYVPQRIPIHFDWQGEADGYGSRWFVFLGPGVILALILLADVFRYIDPKKRSYAFFEGYYYGLLFAVSLLMLLMEGIMIASALGSNVNVKTITYAAVGILLALIGNMMPKFKHNYFVGIKTSWTLANEEVWYRTHRFAAKLYFAGGILLVLAAFLPAAVTAVVLGADLLVLLFVPVAASYVFFHRVTQQD